MRANSTGVPNLLRIPSNAILFFFFFKEVVSSFSARFSFFLSSYLLRLYFLDVQSGSEVRAEPHFQHGLLPRLFIFFSIFFFFFTVNALVSGRGTVDDWECFVNSVSSSYFSFNVEEEMASTPGRFLLQNLVLAVVRIKVLGSLCTFSFFLGPCGF